MTRGEIWTAAGGPDYAGKPRPVVIVQDDLFSDSLSVTVCPFTLQHVDAPISRLPVEPTDANGLLAGSSLMVDKLATMPRSKLGRRVGRMEAGDMLRLNRGIMVFLGLLGASAG